MRYAKQLNHLEVQCTRLAEGMAQIIINDAVTLANYVTTIVCSLLAAWAVMMIRRRIPNDGVSWYLLRSFSLILLAVAGHQTFWGVSRISTLAEWHVSRVWIADHAWYATFFYVVAYYGMLRIIGLWHSPQLQIYPRDFLIVVGVWVFTLSVSILYLVFAF
jgi:hypothetical protein